MLCCYLVKLELIELQESQKDEYNHFVAAQESGGFLQSWEWGEWQKALGRQVFRYKALDDSGSQAASIQLIKIPLPLGKYYLYAPYGPVLAGGEQYQALSIMYQALQKQFPEAVFVRIEPKFLLPPTHYPLLAKTPNIQPGKTLFIDLSKTQDQLLGEMHHKTRYNIRLAQKHGVEIYPVRNPEVLIFGSSDTGSGLISNGVKDEFDISIGNGLFTKEAVHLIVETSKRQDYKGYDNDYYERMIDNFAIKSPSPNHSPEGRGETVRLHIYKAIYNNQLLSSAIMIDCGNTRTFLFGGSSDRNKNLMAPYLMHFRAMLDAKALGLSKYDFWGVETSKGDTPGFVRFKLGFGGKTVEYGGAYDMILDNLGYKFYTFLRKIKRLF